MFSYRVSRENLATHNSIILSYHNAPFFPSLFFLSRFLLSPSPLLHEINPLESLFRGRSIVALDNGEQQPPFIARLFPIFNIPAISLVSWKIDARRNIVRGTKFAETMDRRREEKKRKEKNRGEYKKIESRAACDINGCCGRGLSGMEEEIKGEAKKKRKRVHRKRFQPFLTISSRRSRERSKYL